MNTLTGNSNLTSPLLITSIGGLRRRKRSCHVLAAALQIRSGARVRVPNLGMCD